MAKTKATKVEAQAEKVEVSPTIETTLHDDPINGDAPFNGDYFNEWNLPVTVVEEQEGVTVVVIREQDETNPFDASLIDNLSTNDTEVKPAHDD